MSYDQHQDGQQPQSYVYPDHGAAPQPPEQEPVYKQQRPGRAARVIGIIALMLAAAVLFSTVTGILVYRLAREPVQQPPGPQPVETVDPSTPVEEEPVNQDLLNPHFDLSQAASRHETGKQTRSVMEIAQLGKPAVVAITTELTMTDLFGQVYRPTAAGSGFILTDDGYIVTNNHVVDQAETITVVLDNDEIYEALLVGTDPSNDLAVIKIKAEGLPTVVLGDSDQLQVGELAVAIGNPLGELSGTVTAGIISALDREITLQSKQGPQTMKLLQTDAAINSGNSGGALFNSFGEVIGINTAKNIGSGVEGLGFAIPITHAKPLLESLIQYGYVRGRPKIGISGRDINRQMADHYQIEQGILVMDIEPGSAAALAGLQKNDIIVSANGQDTLTIEALNAIKNDLSPGDKLSLGIIRDHKPLTVDVTLKEDQPQTVLPASQQPDRQQASTV